MWTAKLGDGRSALAAFLALVGEYRETIKLLMSSHTHFDELRLLTDAQGRVATLGISIPAISPVHGNNPALKLVTLAADGFAPMATKTLYSTPESVAWGDQAYSFAADYGCAIGQTLLACVAGKPRAALEAAMNGEFTVHSSAHVLPWAKVDAAIFVPPSAP
jgi:hypothetical protein